MILRLAKTALILGVALFYFLVVINNLIDCEANYQFVKHVLAMDTIFPASPSLWRSLHSPLWHVAFFLSILGWEIATMVCCGWGGVQMAKAFRSSAIEFHQSKRMAILGLTLGLLMWLVAFLSIGGEWFLMWQSKTWNGQEAAFRMFAVLGIVLILLAPHDAEGQP